MKTPAYQTSSGHRSPRRVSAAALFRPYQQRADAQTGAPRQLLCREAGVHTVRLHVRPREERARVASALASPQSVERTAGPRRMALQTGDAQRRNRGNDFGAAVRSAGQRALVEMRVIAVDLSTRPRETARHESTQRHTTSALERVDVRPLLRDPPPHDPESAIAARIGYYDGRGAGVARRWPSCRDHEGSTVRIIRCARARRPRSPRRRRRHPMGGTAARFDWCGSSLGRSSTPHDRPARLPRCRRHQQRAR